MKNTLLDDEFKAPHFVCTGDCNMVSKKPGICTSQDCTREGQPFTECACEDGNHAESHADTKPSQEIEL